MTGVQTCALPIWIFVIRASVVVGRHVDDHVAIVGKIAAVKGTMQVQTRVRWIRSLGEQRVRVYLPRLRLSFRIQCETIPPGVFFNCRPRDRIFGDNAGRSQNLQ